MKLVMTKPPDGSPGRLHACYINGVYHQFRHVLKYMPRRWKSTLSNLKQSEINLDKKVENIKKNGYDKHPGQEERKLAELAVIKIAHQTDIRNLEKLLSGVGKIDPILEHAQMMVKAGIMEDDWVGE
jgi:hypothetical protein